MPWTVKDVDSKIKGLSPEQKKNWVKIANSALKSCQAKGGSDCEGGAVRIANSKAKGTQSEIEGCINELSVVTFASPVRTKDIKSIETEMTEDGLLIKGLPVFKAGTYRDQVYDIDYIDRNFIGQFNAEEDIPIQRDHSSSSFDTLGWIQNLYRKSKIMYSDFLLIDENAIARWKKGLLKKFSIGVDILQDKVREISIVAFPYVKAARVHADANVEEDTNITSTEVNGSYFVTVEGEQYELRKDKDDYWFFFPCSRRDEHGEVMQEESVNLSDEDIDNIDLKEDIADENSESYSYGEDITKEDFAKWSVKYKNSLPDSSFLLMRRPVKNKSGDRALPIKDKEGLFSRSHVQNALARVTKIKDFSAGNITTAKSRLTRIAKKLGIEVKLEKKEGLNMNLKELQKLDLSKLEGEGSELLREAMEHIAIGDEEKRGVSEKLETSETKNEELAKTIKETKVKDKVRELKEAGKITPAQEESTKSFLITLEDNKIDEFIKVLSNAPAVVKFDEKGQVKTEPKEETKDILDIDALSAADINTVAEKLAKKHDVEFNKALDWCYDDKVSKKGELIEE